MWARMSERKELSCMMQNLRNRVTGRTRDDGSQRREFDEAEMSSMQSNRTRLIRCLAVRISRKANLGKLILFTRNGMFSVFELVTLARASSFHEQN
jgi:hypothetical protein